MKFTKISILTLAVAAFAFACAKTEAPKNGNANAAPTNSSKPANTPANAVPANATSNANAAAPSNELADAKKIYSEKCVRCHKEDGKGGVTDIDGTKIKAPDFTSDRAKKSDDDDYLDAIENGIADEGMPAFKGKLKPEEMKGLVAYIRKEFQK